MAPARPRGIEDSRSETSSSITNLKDRSLLGPSGSSGLAKGKRVASSTNNIHSGIPSFSKNAPNGTSGAAPVDSDPNVARIEWQTLPASTLHTYRHAHRLPTSSAYVHPHADLILASSRIGLRSPSSVTARRKLREAKHQARRKDGSSACVSKHKDRERSSDRLKTISSNNNSGPAVQGNPLFGAEGKTTHTQLASMVRRHFNSQQVSEADVIANFVYVVRHSSTPAKGGDAVGMKGSKVLGIGPFEPEAGCEIGSSGREEDKRKDLGFRLRFKP